MRPDVYTLNLSTQLLVMCDLPVQVVKGRSPQESLEYTRGYLRMTAARLMYIRSFCCPSLVLRYHPWTAMDRIRVLWDRTRLTRADHPKVLILVSHTKVDTHHHTHLQLAMAFSNSPFTTISDVDAAIQHDADRVLNGRPISITSKLTSFENHLLPASPDLTRLLILKELYRCHDAVEDKFKALGQHNRAARLNSDAARRHLKGFYSAFEEITNLTNPPLSPALSQGTHFLDLGCAPGGFATWLLQNTTMQGVGITLPWKANDHGITTPGVTSLGIPLHSDLEAFSPRFTVIPFDLCQVTTGPSSSMIPDGRNSRSILCVHFGLMWFSESIPTTGFDLVIANASIMLAEDSVPWARKIHLTFAQLLVAFQHIAIGGTLIVSLRTRPFDWVIDIVAMLKLTFESVDIVKPSFQAKTSFAYFICQGFSHAAVTVHHIRRCIQYLQYAGEYHIVPWLKIQQSLLTVSQDSEVDTTRIPRFCHAAGQLSDNEIIQLLATAWKRQFNALRADYDRVLNSIQPGACRTSQSKHLIRTNFTIW